MKLLFRAGFRKRYCDLLTAIVVLGVLMSVWMIATTMTLKIALGDPEIAHPFPSSPSMLPSYYYTQQGADGRTYVLRHDSLTEQEGGLRTTGSNQTEPGGGWIYQFKM